MFYVKGTESWYNLDKLILELCGIEKAFKKDSVFSLSNKSTAVLEDISLKLYKNEILGIMGESGCGKSTLAYIISGLLDSDKGQIYYKGQNKHKFNKKQLHDYRKSVQIIFQDISSSLNPKKTVGWLLKEVLDINTKLTELEKQYKLDDILEKMGLNQSYKNRYPSELSGGEKQRICIGSALLNEPEIIIADEAVSALDVSVQSQILNLMLDIKEIYKLSYIFISHDLNVVNYISDRIIIMNKGRIVEEGKTEDVYLNPQNEYTKNLIKSIL